jgi:hypothetical protein
VTVGWRARIVDRFREAWDLVRNGILDPKHYVRLERTR